MRAKYCDEQMQFKLPKELVHAVEEVSHKRMMSRSAYCRQALIEKLERDGYGICLAPPKTVAA